MEKIRLGEDAGGKFAAILFVNLHDDTEAWRVFTSLDEVKRHGYKIAFDHGSSAWVRVAAHFGGQESVEAMNARVRQKSLVTESV